MSNKEILERAIQKAIDGGWEQPWVGIYRGINHDLITGEMFAYWQHENLSPFGYSIIGLIFHHDFSKALWGEEQPNYYCQVNGLDQWQYHLQQMVIADDPIQYLGENIV